MSTFATTANNDIAVQGGQLRLLTGLDAAMSLAKHYAQTLRGEMIHAKTDGIRFFETAFDAPRIAIFEAEFRRRVLQVPHVTGVQDFEARMDNGELRYTVTIVTDYGNGVIDNG